MARPIINESLVVEKKIYARNSSSRMMPGIFAVLLHTTHSQDTDIPMGGNLLCGLKIRISFKKRYLSWIS